MNEESDVFVDPSILELHERLDAQRENFQGQINNLLSNLAQVCLDTKPLVRMFRNWEAGVKVQEFKDAEFENGDLKHPQFDELKGEMAKLILNEMAADLDEAYRIAKLNSKENL